MKKTNAIELFVRFTADWGNMWTARFTEPLIHDVALHDWQAMLDTLSQDEINKAISTAIVTLDFPPSIAQFKKLAIGLLSANDAYQAAKNGDNDLRQLVAGGDWSWRTYPENRLRSEFYQAYDAYMSQTLSEHIEISKELEGGDAETLQLQ